MKMDHLVYVSNATLVFAAAAVPLMNNNNNINNNNMDTTDPVLYAHQTPPQNYVTNDVKVESGKAPPINVAGNTSSLTLTHNWTDVYNRRRDPSLRALDDLVHRLDLYYVPVAIAFGLLANFVAFVVFRVSDIRRLPVTPYLSCLAISDIGFMLSSLFIWMKKTHHHDAICTPGICQMMWFVLYLTNFLSIWYLVCLQVDRYITMWHPTRAPARNDTKRARCVCTVLTIVGMVAYAMVLGTVDIQRTKGINAKKECTFLSKFAGILKVFTKIDTFISAVMPYSALPVLNALILTQIVIRCIALNRHDPDDARNNGFVRRLRSQIKLTASLLCITFVVWGLSVTSQWIRIQDFFKEDPQRTMTRREKLKQNIYQYPHYASVAVKLILYIIFSGTFREGAAECCGGCTCDCSACKEEEEENGEMYDDCEENQPTAIVEHVSQV